MSTLLDPETLTNHVPTRSRRGAALVRAKSDLSDALDRKLNLEIVDQEQRKLELLGQVIGLTADEMRKQLAVADLGTVESWIGKLNGDLFALPGVSGGAEEMIET